MGRATFVIVGILRLNQLHMHSTVNRYETHRVASLSKDMGAHTNAAPHQLWTASL